MMATTSAPFLYPESSFGAGRRTLRTMSASLPTFLPTLAPAASKSLSRIPERTPAPPSTATSAPSPISRFTVSGVPATRGSAGSDSAAIAIFMDTPSKAKGLGEEVGHQDQDDHDDAVRPLGELDEAFI